MRAAPFKGGREPSAWLCPGISIGHRPEPSGGATTCGRSRRSPR